MKNQSRVEAIINELEAVPPIAARGEHIQQIDEYVDIKLLMQAVRIKIKDSGTLTNLVDYLVDDQQIKIMLVEGLRLDAIGQADLADRGIGWVQLTLGMKVDLILSPLDHLQKAEALSLVLLKSGYRSPTTSTLFMDRLCQILGDKITPIDKKGKFDTWFDNLTLLDSLTAAAKEALIRYVGASTTEIEIPRTVRQFALVGGTTRSNAQGDQAINIVTQNQEFASKEKPPTPVVAQKLTPKVQEIQSETHTPIHSSSRTLRVFLCHSSNDKPLVRQLYQRLKSDNFDPWLDEEKLLAGQDWRYEIAKAVRKTDVVIACLSRGSVSKSGYVQKEIKDALDVADEQPEGTIFLIPLKLEECVVPERLNKWHWVNYFDENGYRRLLDALHARAEAK